MLTATGCVAPKTKAGRTATVRPTTNLLTSNDQPDTIRVLRVQRLSHQYGLVGNRANLIAGLAWGEVLNG